MSKRSHNNFRHLKWNYKTPIIVFITEELVYIAKIHSVYCKIRKTNEGPQYYTSNRCNRKNNYCSGTTTTIREAAMITSSKMGANCYNRNLTAAAVPLQW